MELSNSITEHGQSQRLGIRCGNVVVGSVYAYAGGRAWRLAMNVRGMATFEMVLEFGTLVHNFASPFGQQSLNPQRPPTLKEKDEAD